MPTAPRLLTRRRVLGLLGGLVAGVAADTGLIEPHWFEEITTRVRFLRGTAGAASLRVLHLSDLHVSSVVPLTMIAEAVRRGLAHRPDLVLLTGDFWTGRYDARDELATVLAPLSRAAPTWAVAGNHDGGGWARQAGGFDSLEPVTQMLEVAGIQLLSNRHVTTTVAGRPVALVGVGDLWAGDCHPMEAFAGLAARSPGDPTLRLLLNHNPDAKTGFRDQDWDLMLCGHTHGGQLRVPFIGATPFAPVRDRGFVAGLNPWRDRWIYTTRGVGNLHGVRFNCRPEITILEIA